ncbi:hypothetical protein [Mucilaginibacter flavus]|uniref:hypothetical protein n=1 Tax=Mucilaginibacter flavus TaxID=931504 RepID=UPI0025B50114|nr:hypothetical protein [Mucilaginibacter flavus]MDN3580772.1 hypothetical protein [Mucilaginibacter flavus]
MLKNIRKDYLLIAGSILFFLVCYRFSFSHTVEAWKLRRELEQKIKASADLSYQPGYLERKDNNLNHIINRFKIDTATLRSNMITTIALKAEKQRVRLSRVPVQSVSNSGDKYIVQGLDFEGDYFSLCRLLGQLQYSEGIGLVRAVDITSVKTTDNSSAIKKLNMRLFIATIK